MRGIPCFHILTVGDGTNYLFWEDTWQVERLPMAYNLIQNKVFTVMDMFAFYDFKSSCTSRFTGFAQAGNCSVIFFSVVLLFIYPSLVYYTWACLGTLSSGSLLLFS